MPYPIPEDLENIEGWRWYLVPLPDNDQMIRVAWGMWSELTHFWNWGKEGPIPEQSEKAAQLWAAALYEAWRIRDMGFPDLILTYIDEVEGLLRQMIGNQIVPICCDDIASVDDNIETAIIPDSGTAPETWGTEAVTDWGDWRQHVCGAADLVVDDIIQKLETIKSYAGLGFVGAGAAIALLSAFASAGMIALAVTGLAVAGATYALQAGIVSWNIDEIKLDVENARQDIKCAVFSSPGAFRAAVQDATGAAWLFFQYFNWSNIHAALMEGSYGDQDLVVSPNSDCDTCDNPPVEIYDVQNANVIVSSQSMQFDTWYQVPNSLLPQQQPNWRRCHFQIRDANGNQTNVVGEVRVSEGFCNGGTAVSNPYNNNGIVSVASGSLVHSEDPATANFAYNGPLSRAVITSNTAASCPGFVLEVKITGYP